MMPDFPILSDYQQSDDREVLFIDRVEALLAWENTIWLSVLKKKEEQKK